MMESPPLEQGAEETAAGPPQGEGSGPGEQSQAKPGGLPFEARPVVWATPGAVGEACVRARQAQKAWAELPLSARIRAMRPAKTRLLRAAEAVAALLSTESGKPFEEALLSEVLPNADLFDHWLAQIDELLEPEEVPLDALSFPGKAGTTYREPRGVIGLITPWNYPVSIPLRSLVPALLAGNAVLFKPSEVTPQAGALVAWLFEGLLPYGVLELLQGGRDVGEAVVGSDVDLVIFTGSVAAGRKIAGRCAERLVPCSLELGGKDAAIVLADADLERAARGIVWGAMTNAGQNCASIERVYVESAVAEAFIAKVVEQTRALRPGVDVGRLANAQQLAVVQQHVSDAVAGGAEVLAGGEPVAEGSLFFPPTVLRMSDERAAVMRDETFGPILPIVVVATVDEAIARANDCRFGLTASLWTKHIGRAELLARQLRAGVVTINNHGFTAAIAGAPWSGSGESGHGVTNGPHALGEMTRPRFVLVDTNRAKRELWWYPYTPALRAVALGMAAVRGGPFMARLRGLFALLSAFPRRLLER
jgi:acyl-CoA reductase-like NAD-dependent aldehyde dehydrogenase